MQLLHGFAEEFARLDARTARLPFELNPLSALELLPDWERVAGLPDACVPIPASIRNRQVSVARKLAEIGGQSRAYFIDLAERLGVEIEIEEFAPFTTASTVDGAIFDDEWRFTWVVRVLAATESSNDVTRLRFADFTTESGVDEALRSFGIDTLECVIRRAAPAHTNVLFAYPEDPEPVLWFDFLTGGD